MTKDAVPDLPFREYILTDSIFPPGTISVYNIFFNAWAETGIFVVIAMIGIISSVIIKGVPVFVGARKSEDMNVSKFVLPMLLSILLYHQVIYLWIHPWLWTIIAFTYAAGEFSAASLRNKSKVC